MFRGANTAAVVAALFAVAVPCAAQSDEGPSPDATVEKYLGDHGLREVLAAHLLARLSDTEGRARQDVANRLGRIYVELLDRAATPAARQVWEDRSQSLLQAVPEADSFDLRLNLAKARYLYAEEIVERHRLRLARPEEAQDAERVLRSVVGAFQDIATKVHRRVESLEKTESQGREENTEELRAHLADSRRLRSLGMYYAGWSNYYVSYLSGKTAGLEESMQQFGWLLNASGGRGASLERLPMSLLRYEHVARAAIGCALCESLRGNDDTALRWLEAVENGEDLPDVVRAQLPSRRMVVLATAKRWADLEMQVRRARDAGKGKPARALPVAESRLLAVLTLEALQDKSVARFARDLVQSMAETAITDLVTLGEARHVLDLISRYGSAPLSGEGFIVNYVRGLQAYERAHGAMTSANLSADEPVSDDAVANTFGEAAASLQIAVESADGGRFPTERTNAGLLLGLSLFYAGELERAADHLERNFQSASAEAGGQGEESLWLAVVALDKAVEGGKLSARDRRDKLAALFLQSFPRSERAARLLLRQSTQGLMSEEAAVEVLLKVVPESPLYSAARRHAAKLLYGMYRRSRGGERELASTRFVAVCEELIEMDRERVATGSDKESQEAATQVVTRVRQLLDVVMGMPAPDLDRAEHALEVLDAVKQQAALDTSGVQDEVLYRRLQIALARNSNDDIALYLDRLTTVGGRFSEAADRLVYRRALDAWKFAPKDVALSREVVRHGLRVMRQFQREGALGDAAVRGLYEAVAEAAAVVWRAAGEAPMRDTAVGLDRKLLESGTPSASVLLRFAELSESAGDAPGALDAWRTLLAGLTPATPGWYEARYHSLRLLLAVDAPRAREAMLQHKVLYPEYGPEPWGAKLRELDSKIAATPVVAPPPESPPVPDPEGQR